MRICQAASAVALFLAVTPAGVRAEPGIPTLPAGTVGAQIVAIGRWARVNIAVPESALWSKRVPALSSTPRIHEVLAQLARNAGARLEKVGPGSWRLVERDAMPTRQARHDPSRQPNSPDWEAAPDLVVTASKREVPGYQFAAQVTQVPGSDLELGGAGGTDKLASRLTSVASTYLGAGRNKLFIRGVADSSFTGPTQATVGQYFGDLRLSYNAPDPDLRLSDLEAVEVLEGPQGTLYGSGSLGGLIRMIPNAPDLDDISVRVAVGGSLTQHGAGGGDAELVANLPVISDRLAVRVVGNFATEGGYIDKPFIGSVNVNRTRVTGGRATAHLLLAPGWSVELIGIGQRIRGADSQYADRAGPPLESSASVPEGFAADFKQAQMVVTGAFGPVRFRSTTGVTAHGLMERYDATLPGEPVRLFAQGNRTRTEANETRLWSTRPDGSGWLAGLSLIHNRTGLSRSYIQSAAVQPATGVVNEITEETLYGEVSLRLLPGILATGGVRLTHSTLEGAGEDIQVSLTDALRTMTGKRTQTIILPSAAVLVDLTPDAQFFARYQQGFRPGGLAIESDFVRRFRNDRVATIEAGIRFGQSSHGPINGAVTLAHTSWRDIQADFIDGSGLPSTANIGDGKLWTIEGSLGLRVSDELRLEGGISLNDSRIDEPSLARVFDLVGPTLIPEDARGALAARLRQIPNIARVTARAGLVYKAQLTSSASLMVDLWGRYVGSSRLGVGPLLGQLQGSYLDSGLNLRATVRNFGLTASVTNLADVRGNRFALGTPFPTGHEQVTPLRPRTLRIGFDVAL